MSCIFHFLISQKWLIWINMWGKICYYKYKISDKSQYQWAATNWDPIKHVIVRYIINYICYIVNYNYLKFRKHGRFILMKHYKFWINTKQTLVGINARDRNTYINNAVPICKYVWSYLKQINKVLIYVIDIVNLSLRD